MTAQYKATIDGMNVQSGIHSDTLKAWNELQWMIATAYGISMTQAGYMLIGNTTLITH